MGKSLGYKIMHLKWKCGLMSGQYFNIEFTFKGIIIFDINLMNVNRYISNGSIVDQIQYVVYCSKVNTSNDQNPNMIKKNGREGVEEQLEAQPAGHFLGVF